MKLNPEHPVTQAIEDNYHKLLAIAMHKLGYDRISLTESDIEAVASQSEMLCVVVHARVNSIDLLLVPLSEAEAFAQKHGEKI